MAPASPESAHTTSPDWLQAPSDSRNDLHEGILLPPHEDDYPSLDALIDWFKAHSDNFNDRFEGIPPSDSRNEDDEEFYQNWDWDRELAYNDDFTNEILSDAGTRPAPVASADSADGPRRGRRRPREKIPRDAGMEVVPIAAADSAASPRRRRPRRQRSHNSNLNPNGRITCNYEGCGKTFRSIVYLRVHRREHWPDRFHCQQCDYGTHWKCNLRSHQKRMHNPNPDSFHCPQCDFKTTQGTNLRAHQRRQHGGIAGM